MNDFGFGDTLEPIGIGIGAVLVVFAVGTLLGTPWTNSADTIVVGVLQIVGIAAAIAIGIGLIQLARADR